ncbi:MAG TPA: response regulator transcription factor [Solirubrobacteraceae bacterium]|nr:response regulator transcription factor [Solirubrobacteraceae bacterium]
MVIVEDHLAVRKALEILLCAHGHQIVGATRSPERALNLIRATRPDVAIIDIDLGGASGTALARQLQTERPGLGILLYSGLEEPAALAEALACGAHGFVLKAAPPKELLEAVATVAHGDSWLDPRLPRLMRPYAEETPTTRLSPREYEVLVLLADGLTGQAIADRLFLSPDTIRTHVRNAKRKLGAHTRSQAIAMVVRGQEARHRTAAAFPVTSL